MNLERTPLKRNDNLTSLIDNALAAFKSDFSAPILYKQFDPASVKNDVYDESLGKTYKTGVSIYSKTTIDPQPKTLEQLGILEKVDAIFIMAKKDLDTLGKTITIKDLITFNSQDYTIKEVSPLGQIQGTYFFIMVQGLRSSRNV